jgi:hypothetical protein
MPGARPNLCHSCAFARAVSGRAQVYLLCRSESVVAKYPQQPVLACPAYARLAHPDVRSTSIPTVEGMS